MSIKKVTQHPTQNEALIFERSQTGRVGYCLPKLDVEEFSGGHFGAFFLVRLMWLRYMSTAESMRSSNW